MPIEIKTILKENVNWLKVLLITAVEVIFMIIFQVCWLFIVFCTCGEGAGSFLYSPHLSVYGLILSPTIVLILNVRYFMSSIRADNNKSAKAILIAEIMGLFIFLMYVLAEY